MKLKHAAVLFSVALLAACGGGKQEGDVRFLGTMPVTAGQKDNRKVETYCPGCKEPLAIDTARHTENKKCKIDINWSGNYRCPSCRGTGDCAACTAMEQANGDCYNCKGLGVLIFQGQSPDCPNCKGAKKCPICKGTTKCTDCGGSKMISKEIVKARAAKFVSKDGDLPDSDPRPPVEKPKDDMPKKDGAAPPAEEKKEEKK